MNASTLKYLVVIALLLQCIIFVVGASDVTKQNIVDHRVNLKENGKTDTGKTSVDLKKGEMTFTDNKKGISVKTKTKINGIELTPDKTIDTDGEIKYVKEMGGSSNVTISYVFDGSTLKETIVLQQDAELSFPTIIPNGQKLILWGYEGWKIVNATNGDTMWGIEAGIPYGVDASGRYVKMNYTYDGSELHLNYNRTITVINASQTLALNTIVYDYYDIQYPLTIDPTWTAVGDHWVTTDGLYTVVKWNSTGTTSWTVPDGVTSIAYIVVGGGGKGDEYGGGGGGGAGGMKYSSGTPVTAGSNLGVVVGSTGATGCGGGSGSELGGITVSGGSCGGYTGMGDRPYTAGSGGGGAAYYSVGGSAGIYGEGNSGGNGYYSDHGGGGGGGGKGSAGGAGSITNGGYGGSGYSSSITGETLYYAGGGGGQGYGGSGGSGGSSVGGHGGNSPGDNTGCTNATQSTGSGGGGCSASYRGADGVVVVRYLTPPTPTATFDVLGYDGIAPDAILFEDTSTGSPTSWNWSANNVTGNNTWFTFNTTSPYPLVTFGQGNWSIRLNASNSNGYNLSAQTTYINISPQPPTVASFWVNGYDGVTPDTVQLVDSSTNVPTAWNWSYKNVTGNNTEIWFSTVQNPIVTFGIGNWSIKLNASNAISSNISTQVTYVNVSAIYYGTGALSLDGYVKDGESAAVLPNATVTVLQGVINITTTTNGDGYYLAQHASLAPGSSITSVVSAEGHETYQNTSTPLGIYGTLRLNHTLLSLTPSTSGATLMGIVRIPPFNATVDNVTITIRNESQAALFTVTTNGAGFYVKTSIIPVPYIYDIWGSKAGLVNSTIYHREIV